MIKTRYSFDKYLFGFVLILLHTFFFVLPNHSVLNTVFEFFCVFISAFFFAPLKNKKMHISPIFIWHLFWLLPVTIARVYIPVYKEMATTWSNFLVIVVALNNIVFYCTYFFYSILKKNNNKQMSITNKNSFYKTVLLLFIASDVAFVLNVLLKGYIPLLTGNADAVRDAFVSSPFFSIMNVTRFTYILLIPSLKNQNKKKVIILVTISVINFVFLVLTGYRGYIFQIAMFLLASLVCSRKLIFESLFAILIAGFVLFSIVAVLREDGNVLDLGSVLTAGFRYAYLYIYPSFTNMDLVISNITPHNSFLYTTEMFWGIFSNANKVIGSNELYSNFGTFNVGTYLLQPYGDFGLFGTLVWTFIISLFCAYSYKKVESGFSIVGLICLGISFEVIFFMHNGFILRSSSELIWIIAGLLLDKCLCRARKAPVKKENMVSYESLYY